ncbi:hypothetical protein SDC9_136407 [bioreactor metagenome]|uniref:Uncharacterized protein n=1 Tax=bioreactor metagenome TaxID=1076179 RepID=A0A645DJ22_9ZZZZ
MIVTTCPVEAVSDLRDLRRLVPSHSLLLGPKREVPATQVEVGKLLPTSPDMLILTGNHPDDQAVVRLWKGGKMHLQPPFHLTEVAGHLSLFSTKGQADHPPSFLVGLGDAALIEIQLFKHGVLDEVVAAIHIHVFLCPAQGEATLFRGVLQDCDALVLNGQLLVIACATDHAHPFTPPAVRPPMILSCRKI